MFVVQGNFQHAILFEVALDAVFRDHPLYEINPVKRNLKVFSANFRISVLNCFDKISPYTKAAVPTTGAIPAAGAFQQYDVLVREFLPDVVGGRQACVAASYNHDIRLVAAPQRFVDLLVLQIDRLEPVIVNKILVEVRRSEVSVQR